MKILRIIPALILLLPVIACSAQSEKKDIATSSSGNIEAYYFHFTARCVTCRTVEAQTKVIIETLYPEMIKQGKITFQSVNLDDPSSKELAEELQISGQTLLLVKGKQKINITNEGFLYAVSQPDKLEAVIKEKIDSLL
jgi:hypothetical protein